MTNSLEAAYFGSSEGLRAELAEALSFTIHDGLPADASGVSVIFLESGAGRETLSDLDVAGLGADNPFAACRRIKADRDWRVYFLVAPDDVITPEIARFCLADGSFAAAPGQVAAGVSAIRERLIPHRPRVSTDALLSRLEKEIASDSGRQASALQRMLADGESQSLLDRLVDPETGLFDGPFASFKLDEEFKRSMRFHQPLSLLLLDVGLDVATAFVNDPDRQEFLAQVASVFLNECRDIDIIGRFTESTFMVLMPGTGAAGSEVLARRMLSEVRERVAMGGIEGVPVAGLATMPTPGVQNRQAFLARAEACLQMARDGEGEQGFCSSYE